jgi:SAM-dependent methyltransferase
MTSTAPITTTQTMKYLSHFYPEAKFGGFCDIDGTVTFFSRINALLHESFTVLDAGCGRGCLIQDDTIPYRQNLQIFKGKVNQVIGIDVDPIGKTNPYIDQFYQLHDTHWPLASNSVDLCFSSHVVEHLQEPDLFFAEAKRVLKPHGYLCLRTTNLWSYVGLIASLIPNRLHSQVLAEVQDARKSEDVFPTVYRCNTIPRLRAMLTEHGFEHSVYGYEAEPAYFSFSKMAYFWGTVHQKLAPGIIRPCLFAFAKSLA